MGFETAKVITEQGLEGLQRYYGTYRAIVVNNIDEEKHMNRLKVMVPEVMSGIMTWALPKGQHGSTQTGFKYLAPKIGDIVFVTFEFGDPTKPLWEYHGWGIEQIPSPLDGPNKCGIVTPEGNVIVIDDDSGTLNLYFNGDVIVSNKGNSIVHSERDVNIIAGDSIIMNQGTNEGMVIIAKLTEKLNQTVKELENLRNLFNTHVHTGVISGPASTGPTPTQASQPFTQYKQEDYENPKFIH